MAQITILVVDDEPAICKLLDRGFSGYGYHVLVTDNGHEALDIATRFVPNIIQLDISLETRPDGLDICQQIRE